MLSTETSDVSPVTVYVCAILSFHYKRKYLGFAASFLNDTSVVIIESSLRMAYSQQGNMTQSNYIVNLVELQNTINSASGLSPLQQLQTEVNAIQTMVNFDQKRIFTNIISKYDQTPIQVTDDINLSNASLYQNGSVIISGGNGGGGGGVTLTSSGTVSISTGGTSIQLFSTVGGISTNAITFGIGGRTVFSFDNYGRALYYDPSGLGDRFWISSATLVTDRFQTAASGTAYPGKFLQCQDSSGTANWSYVSSIQQSITSPSISISTNGTYFQTGITQDPAMFIDTSGNIGIKTSNPQYTLDISGDARLTGYIQTISCLTGLLSTTLINSGALALGILFV